MKKTLRLMGARKFIDQPKGTFYNRFWEQTEEECNNIISKFIDNPLELIDFASLEIYGDNSGSMSFTNDEDDNFIFLYDANVVGDASPLTTLYLVIDELFIPDTAEYTEIQMYYTLDDPTPKVMNDALVLTKDQVFKIRDRFITNFDNIDNINDKANNYAREYLDNIEFNILINIEIIFTTSS